MDFWKNLSPFEKRLITGGFLLFLLCLFYLQHDGSLFGDDDSGKPEIGVLATSQNDARYRNSKTMVWFKADQKQKIRLGDAIFTGGQSTAQVDLKKGGTVAIDENSLVVFNEFDKENMANLMSGNFKIHVDGSVRFAVNGEVTTLTGRNSDLQITMDKDQKPVFKMLNGAVDVKRGKGPAERLDAAAVPVPPVPAASQAQAAVAPKIEMPIPAPTEKIIPYTWRLSDLYQQDAALIQNRPEMPKMVEKPVTLSWQFPSNTQQKTLVDFADNAQMQPATRYETSQGAVSFPTIALGDHYWRVSPDGERWSEPEKFEVQPRFLEKAEPKVGAVTTDFALIGSKVRLSMTLVPPVEVSGFIGEASRSPNFDSSDTKVFYTENPQVVRFIDRAGEYYYRFRSVSKLQELSNWSEPKKFTVSRPEAPKAPQLAAGTKEGFVGDHFALDFKPSPNAHSTQLQILDQTGNVVAESKGTNIDWIPEAPGKYTARAVSRDVYGRVSPSSPDIPLRVQRKPAPAPAPVVAQEKAKPAERMPSNTGTTSAKIEPPPIERMNDKYSSSEVSVEGSMFSLQSKVQVSNGTTSPISTQIGIRVHHWWGDNGVEGSLKAGVFSLNNASTGGSPKDLEIRYHRRFLTGFPFRLMRELQTTLFAGYEMFRNNGESTFSQQYDLIKLGTYLHFPVSERWDAGGEFVYGIGTDNSKKTEISGHANYYLQRDLSLGVGYRIHLFEAGSTKSSPGVLPYREGYTEGYSSLTYHY